MKTKKPTLIIILLILLLFIAAGFYFNPPQVKEATTNVKQINRPDFLDAVEPLDTLG
jgi:predicted PurR-regulated permease PerM